MTNDQKIKIRDLPPTAVRLLPETRQALAREAALNGRSLHGEIVMRLTNSMHLGAPQTTSHGVRESDPVQTNPLPDGERALLTAFRKMSPEKQLALLSLLK